MNEKNVFVDQLDRIHTTELGKERICKNLNLKEIDVVEWCKEKVMDPLSTRERKGKNYYIKCGDCCITINAYSYTIITAHKIKDTNGRK